MIYIDVIARMGGGQFAAIIPKANNDLCELLKEEIQDGLANLSENEITISLAIGYSLQTNSKDHPLDVFKRAEDNMYARKLMERNSIRNRTIRGILQTLTNKYKEEKVHSERVSYLCQLMGRALHLNEDNIKELTLAGLVHDIGKISLPDAVLYKPSKLTEAEYDVVKKHTEVGFQILKEADEYSSLASYAKSHHERWDGKGYPEGLKGNQIPFFARIICIADAYEAMTSNRPYRQALSPHYALNELMKYAGTQFDPELVNVFIAVIKE